MNSKITVGVVQMTSNIDPSYNLKKIENLVLNYPHHSKIQALFLPECFYSLSNGLVVTPHLVSEENEGLKNIQNLARKLNMYLIGGSVAYLNKDQSITNRAFNIDPNGEIISFYDKIHLFRVNLAETNLDESKTYSAGNKSQIVEIGAFKIGISICFDLRFPEMFRSYMAKGCNILSVSAAFTVPTGLAHWEVLLRARAIENQSYCIASAQVGQNNERISTYGHSMIIDPWGKILSKIENDEGIIVEKIEIDKILKTRETMNVSYIT